MTTPTEARIPHPLTGDTHVLSTETGRTVRVERADNLPSLANGRPVEKRSGDYTFDGLAIPFRKRYGAIRWLVENDAGIVHIMSGRQIGIEDMEARGQAAPAPISGPDLRAAAQAVVDAAIEHRKHQWEGYSWLHINRDLLVTLEQALASHSTTGETDHGK